MRLINIPKKGSIATIDLVKVKRPQDTKYAILSHTWRAGEVTYRDVIGGKYHSLSGWSKVHSAMLTARDNGYHLLWIDTCCIDKSNDLELAEAINSMYNWYSYAKVCYAYLDDVATPDVTATAGRNHSSFANARWFRRGWTLQELLAPKSVCFYDKTWRPMGSKSALSTVLSQLTNIPIACLKDSAKIRRESISMRMSWVVNRDTTREEDIAYCLMGMFNVNMPLLYGEGENAFKRLQMEILKQCDDHTILAWHRPSTNSYYCSPLATSPKDFAGGHVYSSRPNRGKRASPHATTPGVPIRAALSRMIDGIYLAALDTTPPAYIALRKISASTNRYIRCRCKDDPRALIPSELNKQPQDIYLQHQLPEELNERASLYRLEVNIINNSGRPLAISDWKQGTDHQNQWLLCSTGRRIKSVAPGQQMSERVNVPIQRRLAASFLLDMRHGTRTNGDRLAVKIGGQGDELAFLVENDERADGYGTSNDLLFTGHPPNRVLYHDEYAAIVALTAGHARTGMKCQLLYISHDKWDRCPLLPPQFKSAAFLKAMRIIAH